MTGNVESVDTNKHTITLTGPAGNVRTFQVDPGVKNLGKVKKGDQVVLRYTESAALSVAKPESGSQLFPSARRCRLRDVMIGEHYAFAYKRGCRSLGE